MGLAVLALVPVHWTVETEPRSSRALALAPSLQALADPAAQIGEPATAEQEQEEWNS